MAAKQMSKARGVLDGHEMAKMFAWMRPNDLIWNYWVNNYLLGNKPPAFDVLYWNADTTRLPARLHGDFLDLIFTNPFMNAGKLSIHGVPIDMKKVKHETYVIGWHHRSHHAVEGGLPDRPHLWRQDHLHPFQFRPPAEPAEPARQSEGVVCQGHDQGKGRRRLDGDRRQSTRAAGGWTGRTSSRSAPATRSTRPPRPATPNTNRSARLREPICSRRESVGSAPILPTIGRVARVG